MKSFPRAVFWRSHVATVTIIATATATVTATALSLPLSLSLLLSLSLSLSLRGAQRRGNPGNHELSHIAASLRSSQ